MVPQYTLFLLLPVALVFIACGCAVAFLWPSAVRSVDHAQQSGGGVAGAAQNKADRAWSAEAHGEQHAMNIKQLEEFCTTPRTGALGKNPTLVTRCSGRITTMRGSLNKGEDPYEHECPSDERTRRQ
jgi:hypothetical protein